MHESHISSKDSLRLPIEFKKKLGSTEIKDSVLKILRKNRLNTVCEDAKCPNIGYCFAKKTATFMILGDRCTRNCRFCSVKTAKPQAININEPNLLVHAAKSLNLDYIVITSVDRDDLNDYGASHFAACIRALKENLPNIKIDILTPDFKGCESFIDIILQEDFEVFAHNVDTVKKLFHIIKPQSKLINCSKILSHVKKNKPQILVKSGIMVGLGESDEEVDETLIYLRNLGVDIVTIGQYLRPSLKHHPVQRYVKTDSYEYWKNFGENLGFLQVHAGPFVRSSFRARDTYFRSIEACSAN